LDDKSGNCLLDFCTSETLRYVQSGMKPLFALFLVAYAHAQVSRFEFTGFDKRHELSLVGAAKIKDKNLRLTPADNDKAGGAWFRNKQYVRSGFETSFEFQLTKPGGLGGGADGFAFVLQNAGPSALAGRGSAGGFALGDGEGDPSRPGIPNSIAVFFDTFHNSAAAPVRPD
jgi:hypothetical protein